MYSRVIHPPGGIELNARELREERELLGFFVWRNVSVRYKQSLAGPLWAVFQPVTSMIIFTVVFGNLADLPSDGIPYPIFYMSAFVVWTYFANSLNSGASSIVDNQALVAKVYFPRAYLPLAATLTGVFDLAIALGVTLPLLLILGADLDVRWLLMVGPLAVAVAAATGLSLWLSALNARYRDIRFLVPFSIQAGLFASPIAFSSSAIPDRFHTLYGLNPMAGAIEGMRWCVTGRGGVTLAMFLVSAACAVLLLVGGWIYFARKESTFADIV